MWTTIRDFIAGQSPLALWLVAFAISGLVFGIASGYFRARKIQPKGFKWRTFRNEAIFTVINVATASTALAYLTAKLQEHGFITYNTEPASWWVIALEYAIYFFGFDTYFYWLHRWMHKEPVYTWVHKLHHFSTSPNLLTTASVTPIESLINGGWVVLITTALTFHQDTMKFVLPTNIIMGLYVHSGYELFPSWWNRSWATKWFITTTFHDQHHKFFTVNFGGYTTIWDRLCGTMRPKFEADYAQIKARSIKPLAPPAVAAMNGSAER